MTHTSTKISQLLSKVRKEQEPVTAPELDTTAEFPELATYSPKELLKLIEDYENAPTGILYLTKSWEFITKQEYNASNPKIELIGRCEFRKFSNEKDPKKVVFLLTGVEADFARYGRPLHEVRAHFFEFMLRKLDVRPYPICSFESKPIDELFFAPLPPIQLSLAATRPMISHN